MRARVFWIALPIAVAVALWAGPGLGKDDEAPLPELAPPPAEPAAATVAAPAAEPLPHESECETPRDPGPDGDR